MIAVVQRFFESAFLLKTGRKILMNRKVYTLCILHMLSMQIISEVIVNDLKI